MELEKRAPGDWSVPVSWRRKREREKKKQKSERKVVARKADATIVREKAPWWDGDKGLPRAGIHGRRSELVKLKAKTWFVARKEKGEGRDVCVDIRGLKGDNVGEVGTRANALVRDVRATEEDLELRRLDKKERKAFTSNVRASAKKKLNVKVGEDEKLAKSTRRIRVVPRTKKQKRSLRLLFTLRRRYYNKLVELARHPRCHPESLHSIVEAYRLEKKEPKKGLAEALTAFSVSEKSVIVLRHPQFLGLYADIRKDVVLEFCQAMANGWNSEARFQLSFASVKDRQSSVLYRPRWCIDDKAGNARPRVFVTKPSGRASLDKINPLSTTEPLGSWKKLQHDMRLQMTRSGKFWLCVPRTSAVPLPRALAPGALARVVSLDPGVRAFQTLYSPNTGETIRVGDGDISKIADLCIRNDKAISCASKANLKIEVGRLKPDGSAYADPGRVRRRKRRRMMAAVRRRNDRVRHLVDEAHRHLASYLCDNFDVIVLPKFESSKKVRKRDDFQQWLSRAISHKTVRNMVCWSHYRFRTWMRHKANMSGKTLIECGEPYTSQTCGKCGTLNKRLGSKELFACPSPVCDYVADRDANAARNILLRVAPHLSLSFL